jgi:hypothetical protein
MALLPGHKITFWEKREFLKSRGARDQILLKILGEESILVSWHGGGARLSDLAFGAGIENQRRIFHAGI